MLEGGGGDVLRKKGRSTISKQLSTVRGSCDSGWLGSHQGGLLRNSALPRHSIFLAVLYALRDAEGIVAPAAMP